MSMLTEEWWVDFVAGWVSGAVGVVACQPLDTVLTRLQAGQGLRSAAVVANGEMVAMNINAAAVSNNFRGLVSNFGIRSLWKGSSPMIGAVPIQNALLMGGYGFGKRYAELEGTTDEIDSNNSANSNLLPVFVGGCVGGILQSFFMSPVEWIKVNQQMTIGGTGTMIRKFLHNKHKLWNRGLTATLLRDGIPHGVWFASYEYCKTQMVAIGEGQKAAASIEADDSSSSSFYKTVTVPLVSGAFAATMAWAVGYPFDIIKTRIQATKAVTAASSNNATTTVVVVPGVYETAVQLIKEADGRVIRGLYRGFGLKLVRSIPASMIGFFTYEYVSNEIMR